MRAVSLSVIALALAGCATQPPPRTFRGPPRRGPQADAPPRRFGGVFISPMGEPFRSAGDGETPDRVWFEAVDTDQDGRITVAEFRADATRFFTTLDLNKDGEIDPQELDHYETEVAPEIRSMGNFGGGAAFGGRRGGGGGRGRPPGGMGGRRGGGGPGGGGPGGGMGAGDDLGGGNSRPSGGGAALGPRGAGRFGYLDIPEPVASADRNFNRGTSRQEFDTVAIERFGLLDTAHQGVLTRDTLPRLGREDNRRPNPAGRAHDTDGAPPTE